MCGYQLPYQMAQVNILLRQVQSSLSSVPSLVPLLRSDPSRVGSVRSPHSLVRPSTISQLCDFEQFGLQCPAVIDSKIVYFAQLLESHLHLVFSQRLKRTSLQISGTPFSSQLPLFQDSVKPSNLHLLNANLSPQLSKITGCLLEFPSHIRVWEVPASSKSE